MDVQIYAKNLVLNPEAERYIQKKFDRLARHLRSIGDAKLEVSRTSARAQRERVVAQMTITSSGYTLRGQETGVNLFAAVDAVTDVLDRQIRRHKGKIYRSAQARKAAKTGASRFGAYPATLDDGPEDDPAGEIGRVVRTKRFPMAPMNVEDAILQMELLGHDFFLFYNMDTSEYNVAYRRRDGDYGVIEPELT